MSTFIRGERELHARLRAIGGAQFGRSFLGRIGLATVRDAKLHVARKTGTTGRTIRIAGLDTEHVRVTVGAAGPFLEGGTKAHVIVPRRARVLAWGGARTLGGRLRSWAKLEHFAMRVRHPGTHARPFLVPAMRKALRDNGLAEAIVDAWNGAA